MHQLIAVDRHVKAGRGGETAILWEGNDVGRDCKLTFQQLQDEVCQDGFQALADCEEACPLYLVRGDDAALWGDSFECRFNHVGYIVSQQLPAAAYCPQAGASGGDTCVGGTKLEEFFELKSFGKAQLWNGTRSPLGSLLTGTTYLAEERQQLLFKNVFDSYELYDDLVCARLSLLLPV
ncbi:alpha-dioxygenase [Klebsormidium nitens]|uniref:Alpha-dioxygenase n=1 Tax=Klebsormidium nitens TaxID=105231 RepID=A0A1Y1HN78_KLENI|nr:alpha-dioxygenase [Klebsormidium nitens]|eukprot:GAQ80090.1 alpha-dioxygenase [Klebsormidium nitens]